MQTIFCFGDSNVWGGIPGIFNPETGLAGRYPKHKRWTGVLQNELGDNYDVVVEGINARTTTFDEIIPGRPYKNALKQLPISLEIHYPIDLIIFWVGTNDTKIQFNCAAEAIKENMRQLIQLVKASNKGSNAKAPKILLIAPQPIIKITNLHPQLDDSSIEKSQQLAPLYQTLAIEESCEFIDAGSSIQSSRIDGVHLDEMACEKIGKVIAKKVREIL
ncbi:MAG: hypothetical protein KIT27_07995 [Legionellales bacterium]|nr:hypothetical protein [Legionellales bacterium]